MDLITPIVNKYWSIQAQQYIEERLALGSGLNATMRENLAVLYNQITIENGAESLDKARQIITKMHKIHGMEIDKYILNTSIVALVIGLLIAFPGDKLLGNRKYFRELIGPIGVCSLCTGCFGLLLWIFPRK